MPPGHRGNGLQRMRRHAIRTEGYASELMTPSDIWEESAWPMSAGERYWSVVATAGPMHNSRSEPGGAVNALWSAALKEVPSNTCNARRPTARSNACSDAHSMSRRSSS
eukprot:4788-Eustigmatos_ZCMA.PRE.1